MRGRSREPEHVYHQQNVVVAGYCVDFELTGI